MKGNRVKQINNLVITYDKDIQKYRVYNPDGVEVFNDSMLIVVEQRCKACFDYISGKKKELPHRMIVFTYNTKDYEEKGTPNTYVMLVEMWTDLEAIFIKQKIEKVIRTIQAHNNYWQFDTIAQQACHEVLNGLGIRWRSVQPFITVEM